MRVIKIWIFVESIYIGFELVMIIKCSSTYGGGWTLIIIGRCYQIEPLYGGSGISGVCRCRRRFWSGIHFPQHPKPQDRLYSYSKERHFGFDLFCEFERICLSFYQIAYLWSQFFWNSVSVISLFSNNASVIKKKQITDLLFPGCGILLKTNLQCCSLEYLSWPKVTHAKVTYYLQGSAVNSYQIYKWKS